MARGSVRRGDALLAGLLRFGHCGRKLHVSYSGTKGFCVRYACRGAHLNHGTKTCISFGGIRVDKAVSEELLSILSPLGIEASAAAIGLRIEADQDKYRQSELALTEARYEADLARRQYDAVNPANRLVAAELEQRWNDWLSEVQRLEDALSATVTDQLPITDTERQRIVELGNDLPAAWSNPGATAETRKRILRTVLVEIVAKLTEERIELLLHWQGGDHTTLLVPHNRLGQHRYTTDRDVKDLIRELARQQNDGGSPRHSTVSARRQAAAIRGPRRVSEVCAIPMKSQSIVQERWRNEVK